MICIHYIPNCSTQISCIMLSKKPLGFTNVLHYFSSFAIEKIKEMVAVLSVPFMLKFHA